MKPAVLASAVRRLRRSPRLAVAAVLCIAVGTAATSAALTLVSATLLRPLPFPEAERLVRVWWTEEEGEARRELSYPDLVDFTASADSLDRLEAAARARLLFQSNDGARRVEGEAVTPGYFGLLGVEPLIGRLFAAEEHVAGAGVMLLDYRTWGAQHGYDPDVVGSTLRTDQGEHTVIGVLPPSFTGSVEDDSGDIEFWLPIEAYLSTARQERRDVGGIWALGRLAPGRSRSAAAAELAAVGGRLADLHPEVHAGRSVTVEPLGENWRSGIRRGALLVLAAAGLLLLVASLNVAILLLARAMTDQREMAVRAALGAGRRRLLGQITLETVLLVAAGSLLGLGVGPPLLRAVLDHESLVDGGLLGIPVFVSLTVDPIAAGLSCLAFLVTALVAGLAPAWLGSRVDPARVLQEGGRAASVSRRSRRGSSALVFAEVALTMVLVVSSVLLARSYRAMESEDLGFRTGGVLRIALFANEQDVPDDADLPGFYQEVREALAAEPGVDEVGVVWPTVPIDRPIEEPLRAPGLPQELQERGLRTGIFIADPAAFEVLDLPLLAGRGFRPTDREGSAPVALVSRTLAERLAGTDGVETAVGMEADLRGEPVRVVGVVGDTRYGGPREAPGARYEIYLPYAQSPQRLLSLMIATEGDPAALVPPLSRRLAALAPASALDWVGPLDGWVSDLFIVDTRFLLSLVGLFTAAGLFLSVVGLFAVLAESVARRRQELGVRQALGASPGRILAGVVLEGLKVVALGLAAGSLLAWASGRVLESTVYGVGVLDPLSYAGAAVILLGAALAASLLPARSAARVHPAEALRGG